MKTQVLISLYGVRHGFKIHGQCGLTTSVKSLRIRPFNNYAKIAVLCLTFLMMCATMEVVWKGCGSSPARGPFTTESSQVQCTCLYRCKAKYLCCLLIFRRCLPTPASSRMGLGTPCSCFDITNCPVMGKLSFRG